MIDEHAAASGVLVRRLIDELGFPLNRDAAVCLYAALVCDTTTFAADGWDIIQWLKWHPTIVRAIPVIALMAPGTSMELEFKVLARHELPIDPPVFRGLVRGAKTASQAARSSEV